MRGNLASEGGITVGGDKYVMRFTVRTIAMYWGIRMMVRRVIGGGLEHVWG